MNPNTGLQSPDPNPTPSAPLQTPPPAEPLQDEFEPEVGFWQEPWVQNILPLLTSLAVHLAIILIGIATFKAIVQSRLVTQEQIIVPDAAIMEGDVGGIPNPGLDGDPNRPSASDLVPENTRSEGWNREPSKSLQAAVLGGSGDTASDTAIGIGASQSLGKGKGTGVGSGDDDGASAGLGVPGGGRGIGPKSPFMGVSGNAKTVAYVCDASGSMMGLPFDLLRIELKKAVGVLVPSQAFNIVFFQKSGANALSPTMVVANPNNKSKAYTWLQEVALSSDSNPMGALRVVFAQKPQLIYLLTDGDFSQGGTVTNEQVIEEIRKLNVSKQTRINTIAFFTPDQAAAERKACEDVLRAIAKDSGGQFKVVLTTDLTQ